MTGYLSLAPGFREATPQVGDLVGIEILLDEKIGTLQDGWQFPEGKKWLSTGSLTISAETLKVISSEGNTTKLSAQALVHQPGLIANEEFVLLHIPSSREIPISRGELSQEAAELTQSEESPPPWTLPPIPFGGWNIFLIVLLSVLLLAALFAGFKKFGQRIRSRRRRNHKDSAVQALQALQKFARSKKVLEQEEWKKFSFELARIIRKYSDENFKIDSSDMTDREFLSELRLNAKARPLVDTISTVLNTIDEVRYGKKDLEATVVPGLLLESRKFFEQTYIPKEGEGSR